MQTPIPAPAKLWLYRFGCFDGACPGCKTLFEVVSKESIFYLTAKDIENAALGHWS
jgi:hypothetical protein